MDDRPTIAMIVDNYFEQSEMEEVRSILQDANFNVDLVAVKNQNLQAMDGDTDKGDAFEADLLLEEVDADDYDAVVLPGGVINSDSLRLSKDIHQFLTNVDESDKLIAAICHAPWVLISADLVESRTMTAYPSLRDDLRNAGAIWVDQDVVVDGNLITSRHPGDIQVFSEAIIDFLESDREEE